VVDVLVGVVHAEGLIDGGALVHEVDGAAGVSRYVTDGQQSVDGEVKRSAEGSHFANTTADTDVTFDLCGDTAATTLHCCPCTIYTHTHIYIRAVKRLTFLIRLITGSVD